MAPNEINTMSLVCVLWAGLWSKAVGGCKFLQSDLRCPKAREWGRGELGRSRTRSPASTVRVRTSAATLAKTRPGSPAADYARAQRLRSRCASGSKVRGKMVPPVQVSPLIKVNEALRARFAVRFRVNPCTGDPSGPWAPAPRPLAPEARTPLAPTERPGL